MKKIDPAIFKLTTMAFLTVLVSPFASSLPDGLEWCANHLGFFDKALANTSPFLLSPPLKDYNLGFLSDTNLNSNLSANLNSNIGKNLNLFLNTYFNTFLAGLIGLIIILGAFYLPRLFRKTH